MTDPVRATDETHGTEVGASNELDVTQARPTGSPSPLGRGASEPAFGPPENPGEVGKIGRYRVLKKLGQGGMGAVYLGFDVTLGRKVALKVMLPRHAADPESRERFLREARAVAMVASDHVVTVFDVGDEHGVAFIAMEYLLGSPLDQYMRSAGELPLAQVYRVGRETALGLAAAHDLGLIHRDIKPGNIWLEAPKGRVKILDFGLARAADDDTQLTTTGLVVGTPAFMSPEQARGLKIDGRSDLFSLGVVLYRLATGKMPFDGTTTMAILTSLAVDDPTPARQVKPDLPRALAAIIHKLLAKRPDDRYATAWEVAEALGAAERLPAAEGESSVIEGAVPMAIPVQSGNVWEALGYSATAGRAPVLGTEIVQPPATGPAAAKPAPRPSRLLALVGAALLVNLVAVIVVAAVLIVRPAKGTLIIDSEDPDAELRISKDGEAIRERTRDREIRLEPGSYTAVLVGGRTGNQLAPDTFAITSRKETRLSVTADRSRGTSFQLSFSPNRRGAEYVFALGGAIRVEGSGDIWAPRALPGEPFTLTRVDLTGRPGVTDDGLAKLKECKGVRELLLAQTAVTDAGLVHFRERNLVALDLDADATVTDVGLRNFKDCKNLERLRLHGTGVTDAGLAQFAAVSTVTDLRLSATRTTDLGLSHFRNSKKRLERFVVCSTAIGDAGLAHFDGATELVELELGDTAATDAGLANFRGCKRLLALGFPNAATDAGAALFTECKDLRRVRISGSQITDAGLANFRFCKGLGEFLAESAAITDEGLSALLGFSNLTRLDVSRTKVTESGVTTFAQLRPRCRIVWDKGVIEPRR